MSSSEETIPVKRKTFCIYKISVLILQCFPFLDKDTHTSAKLNPFSNRVIDGILWDGSNFWFSERISLIFTIEINSLQQYLYLVPFVFQDFPNWNLEILPYFVFNLFLE